MRYYKAIEIPEKPLIVWSEVPQDDEDGLIIPENEIPAYIFGVCPWRIEAGELVARGPDELEALEQEFINKNILQEYQDRATQLMTATFDYDGNSFPMHEVARIYYAYIEITAGNKKVLNTEAFEYTLLDANREAFCLAFKNELSTILIP